MTLALIIVALAFVASLVLLALTQRQHHQTVGRLVEAAGQDRVAHRAEVQELLQRIQAPEVAVVQYATGEVPVENRYPLDDEEQAQAQDVGLAAKAILEEIHSYETEVVG